MLLDCVGSGLLVTGFVYNDGWVSRVVIVRRPGVGVGMGC